MTVKLSPHNHSSNLYSMGTQSIPPGCSLRSHAHQRNDEILFIYEGTGMATVDGKQYPVAPESTIFVGRFVEHVVENTGNSDLKFLWIIFPPGLEDVIAFMGRPRKPGEAPPDRFERPADVGAVLDRAYFVKPKKG